MLETARAAMRGEPVLVQALVLIALALATHFGLNLSELDQTAVCLVGIGASSFVTRAFTRAKANSIPVPSVIVGSHGPELITASTPRAAAGELGPDLPQPQPSAAVPSALSPKEPTMDIQAFVAAAKAKVAQLEQDAAQLWANVPAEFQHPALDAVKAGVSDLADFAKTEVEQAAPADLTALIDAGIAKVQADADAQIAKLNDAKATVAAVTA